MIVASLLDRYLLIYGWWFEYVIACNQWKSNRDIINGYIYLKERTHAKPEYYMYK